MHTGSPLSLALCYLDEYSFQAVMQSSKAIDVVNYAVIVILHSALTYCLKLEIASLGMPLWINFPWRLLS